MDAAEAKKSEDDAEVKGGRTKDGTGQTQRIVTIYDTNNRWTTTT